MVRGRDRVDLRLGDGVPHAQPGVALGVLHHQARRIPRHRPPSPNLFSQDWTPIDEAQDCRPTA